MDKQPVTQPPVETKPTKPEESLVRPVAQKRTGKEVILPVIIILAIILAGALTGYFLANRGASRPTLTKELEGGVEVVSGPKEVGIKDVETFRDTTEGKVEVNDGEVVTEGSHKLIRPGGESQTAYLTSSVVDLDQFLGKCVQVWGETFAGQQAAWLMDVGRVKILDRCPDGL